MIFENKKLRKVSEGIFQEVEPLEDCKPWKWQRGFKSIILPLKNIEIVTDFCSFWWEEEKVKEPFKMVRRDILDEITIKGIVDEEQIRHSFYVAIENEKDIFSVKRTSGSINVSITTWEEHSSLDANFKARLPRLRWEENDRANEGSYTTTLGEDGIRFDLAVPEEQMLSLISALRADPNSTVNIEADLLSLSLADKWERRFFPRDIIILADNDNPCYLSRVGVTSKIGQHCIPSESEYDDEIEDSYQKEKPSEQRAHQELIQMLLRHVKPLNRLVIAIWILIIVIVLSVIFG